MRVVPVCVASEIRQRLRSLVRLVAVAHSSSSALGADIAWSVPDERNPLWGGVHGRMMEQRGIAPNSGEWFMIGVLLREAPRLLRFNAL